MNNDFFTYFVISLIVSSLTVAVIMAIKKVFGKQLTAKWQYNLWFLFMVALLLPMLPTHLIYFGDHLTLFNANPYLGISPAAISSGDHVAGNLNWLKDFTVSVNRPAPAFLNIITASIWFAGVLVFAVLTIHSWLKIKYIKRTSFRLENKEVLSLLEESKRKLNIKGDLPLLESPLVKSPIMFGFFKPCIVLPVRFYESLSMNELKYVMLHELNHYKNKDHLTNYLIVAFQLLYWFNPLVWMAFGKMRLDREIACDIAVLKSLDKQSYAEYGNTIIHFAEASSRHSNFTLASQLASPREQVKKRIESIAAFKTESKRLKMKSIVVVMLAGVLTAGQVPLVSAMASDGSEHRFYFNSDRVVYEDLSSYFAGYEGSFVLYDLQNDQYRIFNEEQSELRVSPDSTYKIFSLLYSLESNVITRENSSLNWNGEWYPYEAWNKDQDLFTAMKGSVNWYFQELEGQYSRDDLQAYLNRIGYGNANLSSRTEPFWLESSLKISPVEQVQLLKSFYTNQFGFNEQNIQTVKDAILLEEKEGVYLSGKTGTGAVNNKTINGWFIGYVENKGTVYFFATNIQNEDHAYGSTAAEITLSILRDKGIYK